MAFELDRTAWGFGVVKIEDGKRWYISKVHKDGTYDFTGDYSIAKRWKNREIAVKHLAILKGGKA